MPRKVSDYGEGTRYDLRRIGAEVRAAQRASGVSLKDVCEFIGINRSSWSRKCRCDTAAFTLPELAKLADLFGKPPGWPMLTETQVEQIIMQRLRGALHSPPSTASPPNPSRASLPIPAARRRTRRGARRAARGQSCPTLGHKCPAKRAPRSTTADAIGSVVDLNAWRLARRASPGLTPTISA